MRYVLAKYGNSVCCQDLWVGQQLQVKLTDAAARLTATHGALHRRHSLNNFKYKVPQLAHCCRCRSLRIAAEVKTSHCQDLLTVSVCDSESDLHTSSNKARQALSEVNNCLHQAAEN
eukprot:TRINITY_DN5563_c0_g1_i1.p1 TRINITY_DN5563_c0_g1~~TRINITY_DN5563_c0_g1_i1.p1  ORF type:complete len:117 (-),score=25.09 TRINITY_DN5563_c0_g1_i1:579-929(-)